VFDAEVHRLLADPDVLEVMVVAGREVWFETRSGIRRGGTLSDGEFAPLVERLLRRTGRRIDLASPTVEARLADGSRLCAVLPPVAVDGGVLCVRKFAATALRIADFADPAQEELLRSFVRDRRNIVVSGATSSGKTSLLGALGGHVSPDERVVVLEDTTELRFALPHVVRLQSRQPSAEGRGAVTMEHLVRTALRLRPDRLIVGEVRGSEVLDMLLALNTGHDGSWTTCHANSPHDARRRIIGMALRAGGGWTRRTVEELLDGALDVIVHLSPPPGRRVVSITDLQNRTSC